MAMNQRLFSPGKMFHFHISRGNLTQIILFNKCFIVHNISQPSGEMGILEPVVVSQLGGEVGVLEPVVVELAAELGRVDDAWIGVEQTVRPRERDELLHKAAVRQRHAAQVLQMLRSVKQLHTYKDIKCFELMYQPGYLFTL